MIKGKYRQDYTARVSVCPGACPSTVVSGCGSVLSYGHRVEGATPCIQYSLSSVVLCANTIQILNYSFFFFVVKRFPSQCRQIAVGTAIVFGGVTLGMYPTDLYCNTWRKILSGLLFQTIQKLFIWFRYLIKINTPRGLSNCWMFKK